MDSDELKNRLSANLKKIRKAKNLSQFELAEKAGLSDQTINSIEGKRLWPSDKTMIKIANALETDAYQFLIPETIENKQTDIIIPELKSALKKNIDFLIEEFFTQHFN
ncbi:MAG: helix-turn-helix transcriptional regulator [Spirochaetales bacterium]|nr:helix-turn-helix transcriptional regulator [Spirochaetales bacterium]